MSCGAPLFSYSRFRDGDAEEEPSNGGVMILVVIIVVTLLVAGVCCWCFARKPGGCALGGCGRSGGRAAGGGGAIDVKSFDELQSHSAGKPIVMFYAPWCHHCKLLIPEFEKAAQKANAPYLLVDCDKVLNQDQMKKYGVKGFPTVVMMSGGNVLEEYKGDRTADAILTWSMS